MIGVALSLKQLTKDPWEKEIENLKKGSEVDGIITRITPYGAFVRINPVIEALLYLMNDETEDDKQQSKSKEKDKSTLEKLKNNLKVGETKKFIIAGIDKEERRITLNFKE